MSLDVSKDPRILMVEYVVNKLTEMTINKRYKLPSSKEKTLVAINKLNSTIKNIKYSYIPPLDLINNTSVKEIDLMANQFWDAIIKNNDINEQNLNILELKFIFNILKGFRARLEFGNEVSIDKAIDIIAVKVISVSKLSKNENLYLCRVADGEKIINIITNLKNIKKNSVIPAAILPPRVFGQEISEAMFCSGNDIPALHDKVGERITNLSEDLLKEVNHFIIQMIKSLK